MRIFLLLAFWLLICSSGFAADQNSEKQPQGETEAAETRSQKNSKPDEERNTKQSQWPRPYQPREEIRVDVTVPFPTDI